MLKAELETEQEAIELVIEEEVSKKTELSGNRRREVL